MEAQSLENDSELQHILWACYQYWRGMSEPSDQRAFFYGWVLKIYKERFHNTFHQSKLVKLVTLGFLQLDGVSRGGNRRYYKLTDPDVVLALLNQWQLS